MSNVGGGNDNNRPPPPPPSGSGGPLDDFLDPRKSNAESDNLKRARAELSDAALPISFQPDEDPTATATDPTGTNATADENAGSNGATVPGSDTPSSSLVQSPADGSADGETAGGIATPNPFLDVVSNLSPSDLISKFTSSAHPRVQDAVRSTILSLIGTLPQMAFETTTITTGERLASLMFQLQMSGYMFKNAEYRLSLSQSLREMDRDGSAGGPYLLPTDGEDVEGGDGIMEGKVRGTIKVSYAAEGGGDNATSPTAEDSSVNSTVTTESFLPEDVEVDAQAYTSELRAQVSKLRASLADAESVNEQAVQKDLLLYIRTLPKQELQSLTGDMSVEVLAAMKGLVNVVINGISGAADGGFGEVSAAVVEGGDLPKIKADTVTEQSGEAMAQLCMWQLVVGYNLRELEVREELKNRLEDGRQVEAVESSGGEGEGGEDEDAPSVNFDKGGFE